MVKPSNKPVSSPLIPLLLSLRRSFFFLFFFLLVLYFNHTNQPTKGVDKAGKQNYDLANGMQHRLNRVIAQLRQG